MELMLGNKRPKLYIGDKLLYSDKYFEGHLRRTVYQFPIDTSNNIEDDTFDPSKPFEITVCVYIKDASAFESGHHYAAFGGYFNYYDFPSIELNADKIWVGLMYSGAYAYDWSYSTEVPHTPVYGEKNYYKLVHDALTGKVYLYHKTSTTEYEFLKAIDPGANTLKDPNTLFCFGGIAKSWEHHIPQNDSMYVVIEECSLISDGKLIFGGIYHNVEPTQDAVSKKDVNFYDYDGAIVFSYTADEFASLPVMPANPAHKGLTAQGWNWSLTDAKTYVTEYGKLDLGQMYITDDGKTRLYIHLDEGRLSPTLGLAVNGTVDVDWGDDTAHGTLTGSDLVTLVSTTHTYAEPGEYIIALTPSTGSEFTFIGTSADGSLVLFKAVEAVTENRVYQNSIKKLEIGSGVTSIGLRAFNTCYSLQTVTIPSDVTNIDGYAFSACYSLQTVNIPSDVTSIGTYAFNTCYALQSVIMPDSVTSIGTNAFNACRSLQTVNIPSDVTSIGTNTFYTCYSLQTVTIPSSVTSIGANAFNGCQGLGFIKFESDTPPTVASSNAFDGVPTDCIIYVPEGSLEDYEDNTNYPDPDVYQYVEY